jgi:hypothetical protein
VAWTHAVSPGTPTRHFRGTLRGFAQRVRAGRWLVEARTRAYRTGNWWCGGLLTVVR